jgi:hypothetical protein
MVTLRVIEGGAGKDKRLSGASRFRRGYANENRLYRPSSTKRVIAGREVVIERERFEYIDRQDTLLCWRRVVCTIEEIGVLCFLELQPDTMASSRELWTWLDGYSFDMAELGCVIEAHWEWIGADVSDYGNILELQHVATWGETQQWTTLFEDVLMSVFPKHSIVLAQAWPETVKYVDELMPKERARYQLRKAALMKRMTQSNTGFAPLGDSYGADGWMWRCRADLKGIVKPAPYREPY